MTRACISYNGTGAYEVQPYAEFGESEADPYAPC
jgi:hypothetical protein